VVGLIVPNIKWGSPKSKLPPDEELQNIIDESQHLAGWFEVYEETQSQESAFASLEQKRKRDRLVAFNQSTQAERDLSEWIGKHRPTSYEDLTGQEQGRQLLERLQHAKVESFAISAHLQRIESIESQVAELRGEIRRQIVRRSGDGASLDGIRNRLATMRAAAETNAPDLRQQAEEEAEVATRTIGMNMIRRNP